MSATRERTGRLQLLAASLLTGVMGAATIYLSELYLGLDRFASLAQLWTLWALCAASVTFGVQQWVVRSIQTSQRKVLVGWLVPRIVPVAVVAALTSAAVTDVWFDGGLGFPVLCGCLVLGTAANGYGRGVAATTASTSVLALLVLGENLIRLLLLVPLVLLDADPLWFGAALVAGFAINLLLLAAPSEIASQQADRVGHRRPLAGGLAEAGLVGFAAYATMFGGPLLLAFNGVDDDVISALFLVITLARIPFVVVLGLLPRWAADLEQMVSHGDLTSVRVVAQRTAGASAAAALLVCAVALAVANESFGHVLGTDEHFGGVVYACVGGASVLALGALVLTIVLLTLDRRARLWSAWMIPICAGVVGTVTGWLDSVFRLAVGLLVVESFALAALLAGVLVDARSPAGTVTV